MRCRWLLAVALAGFVAVPAGCGGRAEDRTRERTGPSGQPPARPGDDGLFGRIPGVVRKVGPSTVAVLVEGGAGRGEGSGVIWRSDGVIVTNHHVVAGARRVQVALASGQRIGARVQASDPRTDLAILRVRRDGLPAAEIASTRPQVGELAVAMGAPLGFENTATAGIVSGLDRSIPTGGRTPALVGLIQTDAPISPGNSGGPLANATGQVIGINVAYIPPQARAVSIGFAIPSTVARDVISELLADGSVEHAFLGVQLGAVTADIAERFGLSADEGALVLEVVTGSPADRAGLRPGDLIVEVAGQPARQVEDVLAALRRRDPGDRLAVVVVRGGDRREVTVRLGELPSG